MKRSHLVYLILGTIVIAIAFLFYFLNKNTSPSINFGNNKEVREFWNDEKFDEEKRTLVIDKKKVVWYRMISPIKNEAKGFLFLKFEDGTFDTSRITPLQTAAISNLLRNKNIEYSLKTKSLIISDDLITSDSTSLNL